MGIPDWPASWEICTQVKEQQLELDMEQKTGSKLGRVCQGCILSLCLFNLYTEYIMWYASLDESQAGIKIAGRNINNLRYADDTTLMAESNEELKSLLMKVKEEWKSWLKTQHSENKIMVSSPITSWQIGEETVETVRDFILGGSKITARLYSSHKLVK